MCKCNALWDRQEAIGRTKQRGPANRQIIHYRIKSSLPAWHSFRAILHTHFWTGSAVPAISWHRQFATTVEPLLSGPPLSGHPLLNGHISKSRNFCNTNTINYPSIKQLPLLSGRGHPKSGPKWCFMSIFTSIKRPACRIYLAQHLVKRAADKSRANLLYL
jgi:hypothetical protein